MVNPKGHPPDVQDEQGFLYYNDEIIRKYFAFSIFYFGGSSLIVIICTQLLKEPKSLKCRVFKIFSYLKKGKKIEWDKLNKEESKLILAVSNLSFNLQQEVNHSIIQKSQLGHPLAHPPNSTPQKTPPFVKEVVLQSFITILASHYCILTFRQSCSFLGFNDYISVTFLILSSGTYIFSTILTGYFWNVFSVKTFIFTSCVWLALSQLIAIMGQFVPNAFLFSILVSRMVNASQFLINDYVCFGLFDPFEGLVYTNWFNISLLLTSVFETLVNWIFLSPSRFFLAFWIFLISVILLSLRLMKSIPSDLQKILASNKEDKEAN